MAHWQTRRERVVKRSPRQYGQQLLFRRRAVEFAGSRHALMERDRIEIETVGLGQCAEFQEDAREEHGGLQGPHHFAVARGPR
jgi:hypothetical protein